MRLTRRETLLRLSAGVAFGMTAGNALALQTQPAATKPAKPPPIEHDEVREFVAAAHGKIDRVQEMLLARPSIVNATWDWGGGDFETALGGASHMGRPDIARLLLRSGARLDLFAAAMLGMLPVVQGALTLDPSLLKTPGPHKIPLIVHAEKGGEAAKAVLDYLKSLEDA